MNSRIRSLLTYGGEAVVIGVILFGVYAYQTRNLLPTKLQPAPALSVPLLDGSSYDISHHAAPTTLVYFFAPWCNICAASSGNIDYLRKLRDDDELQIVLVALDWQTQAEVQEYVEHHEISGPVLLGDRKVASDWNVYAFPTYYILDSRQRIIRRDLGYSTFAGLWWRTL
ncbi:MAG: TlpA family protein disulfide reductase [Proteobacteria bacterium]|nr:TlpA family protein disulfide reductase [Pseudomonadota bacterium]